MLRGWDFIAENWRGIVAIFLTSFIAGFLGSLVARVYIL